MSTYINIKKGDEDDLQDKIESYGPAAVSVDSSSIWFQLYFSEIYENEGCSKTKTDHGVGCVGFSVEDEKRYWIVRYSWGWKWLYKNIKKG